MARRGNASSLRRTVGRREPKKRVVVVCEGSKTEPDYLLQLTQSARNALVDLVIADSDKTSPKQIVEKACDLLKESQREAKRTKDVNARADEVWCAFDVDEHPFIKEAVQQAEANGVHLAISNPSVELWFLLHFEDCYANVHRDDARKRLEKVVQGYAKGNFSLEPFQGFFAAARERAQKLDDKHQGDATIFPENNPSSGMWRLIESVEAKY